MWVDELPKELRAKVNALIIAQPSSAPILEELYNFASASPELKRRKIQDSNGNQATANGQQPKNEETQPQPQPQPQQVAESHTTQVTVLNDYKLLIASPINSQEIIFELSTLSFSSPLRRRFHLVFHLYIGADNIPRPVLSVVNVLSGIPEISVTNLQKCVRLCVLMPILGNTSVPSKKDTAMLCFWLHKEALLDPKRDEPIICTFNLDLVKKQLTKDGKIPPNAESQLQNAELKPDGIKPINELIIDFLQRQFSLCGVRLTNFMPSSDPTRNQLTMNTDNAIAISLNSNQNVDFVAVSAYKGSKEGTLLMFATSLSTASLVFGFKKPIVLLDFSSILDVAYKDIAKHTFTVTISAKDPTKPNGVDAMDFSMIDHSSHLAIDEFVKKMNVADNSFDQKHQEKKVEVAEPQTEGPTDGALPAEEEDLEDDGSYHGGSPESENDEEFDSNHESSDDENDKLQTGVEEEA